MRLYDLLRNQIDIVQVPFSDRGVRILVYKEQDESRLYVKLAERLTCLDPALEAHINRPPFIRDLSLLGLDGHPLAFSCRRYLWRARLHNHRHELHLS